MDALQINDFLSDRETGVLSLGRENDSYAIPVSFAYDPQSQNIYLRLGYGPRSTKRQFVEAVNRASFVTYAVDNERWKSVLARGQLETVSESTLDSSVAEALHDLRIPYFRVHGDSTDNMEFEVVRMDISELTGIISGQIG
jgi:nitroimidazol reductase NimA-like FMN-containing flavoprotein (pyridoxamine 5'-phosphate oxidase superfamily)